MFRMLLLVSAACCILAPLNTNVLKGQEPSRWEATSPPTLDFANLVIGKIGMENGQKVVMLIKPIWQPETRTRTINVTKYVTETRTRTVQTPDNRTEEQAYTVQVPVTEQREVAYTVMVPGGKEKVTIPLASATAWNIQGKSLSAEELTSLLAKPTHLMMLPDATPPAVTPYYATALNPALIFLSGPVMTVGAGLPAASENAVEAPAPRPETIPAPAPPIVDPSA